MPGGKGDSSRVVGYHALDRTRGRLIRRVDGIGLNAAKITGWSDGGAGASMVRARPRGTGAGYGLDGVSSVPQEPWRACEVLAQNGSACVPYQKYVESVCTLYLRKETRWGKAHLNLVVSAQTTAHLSIVHAPPPCRAAGERENEWKRGNRAGGRETITDA